MYLYALKWTYLSEMTFLCDASRHKVLTENTYADLVQGLHRVCVRLCLTDA